MDARSIAVFSNGSFLSIKNAEDEEPMLLIFLAVNDSKQRGIYNLKIIPTYNDDLSSSHYNVMVKLDNRNHTEYRAQRNGLYFTSFSSSSFNQSHE